MQTKTFITNSKTTRHYKNKIKIQTPFEQIYNQKPVVKNAKYIKKILSLIKKGQKLHLQDY